MSARSQHKCLSYTAASAVSTNLSSRSSLRCIAASLSAPAASADDIVAAHNNRPLSSRNHDDKREVSWKDAHRFVGPAAAPARTRPARSPAPRRPRPRSRSTSPTPQTHLPPPATDTRQMIFPTHGVAQKACSTATKTHPSGGENPGRWGRYGARPPPVPCTASSARAAPLDPPEALSGSARQSHASISRQTAPTCTHKPVSRLSSLMRNRDRGTKQPSGPDGFVAPGAGAGGQVCADIAVRVGEQLVATGEPREESYAPHDKTECLRTGDLRGSTQSWNGKRVGGGGGPLGSEA